MFDFEALYNNIEEYRAFRDDPEAKREYDIWTDWKVRIMTSLVPNDSRFSTVLEIGSAFGVILDKVSSRLGIANAYGLDIARVNTEMGKSLFPHLHFVTGTLETTDIRQLAGLGENKFDLIILCDIIEHIPDEYDFMRKVRSIANHALINLPLEKSLANRGRNYGVSDISGHLRSYNLSDGMALIRETGWKVDAFRNEIVYDDEPCFQFHKTARNARVAGKSFPKKQFWSSYYSLEDLILKRNKSLYIKLRGANLFALLSSDD